MRSWAGISISGDTDSDLIWHESLVISCPTNVTMQWFFFPTFPYNLIHHSPRVFMLGLWVQTFCLSFVFQHPFCFSDIALYIITSGSFLLIRCVCFSSLMLRLYKEKIGCYISVWQAGYLPVSNSYLSEDLSKENDI